MNHDTQSRRSAARPAPAARAGRAAFTLIELLIVISIIALLVAAVIFVAPRVFANQSEASTSAMLTTLDRALDEYFLAQNRFPLYDEDRVQRYVDVFDAAYNAETPTRVFAAQEHALLPGAFMFYSQARGFGAVDDILSGLPEFATRSQIINVSGEDIQFVDFQDVWGKQVLFVHPQNDAAQALFGRCTASRPYFMSAGIDEAYGFATEGGASVEEPETALPLLEDNLYSNPAGNIETGATVDQLRRVNLPEIQS